MGFRVACETMFATAVFWTVFVSSKAVVVQAEDACLCKSINPTSLESWLHKYKTQCASHEKSHRLYAALTSVFEAVAYESCNTTAKNNNPPAKPSKIMAPGKATNDDAATLEKTDDDVWTALFGDDYGVFE